MNENAYLGRGWSFPPQVDPVTGRLRTCSAEEDIRQAVYIIVMTKKGERAMMPDFGCNLHEFVFELPDNAGLTMMRNEIIGALVQWEPRIVDISVEFDLGEISGGKLQVDIGYTVRDTNHPYNLVFPYYLYEGIGRE